MARFTIDINEIIKIYDLFDFNYDVPVGITKNELEDAFIKRYRYREIGFETYQMWVEKFELLWVESLKKYAPLFSKSVDIFNNYKSTLESKQTGKGENTSEMTHVATPVSQSIVDDKAPSSLTRSQGGSESEYSQENVSTRQTKSDVELYNDYIKNYQTALNAWLNEFNAIMLRRY